MSIVLDANILIALQKEQDAHHQKAQALLLEPGDFLVHPLTMAEVLVGGVRIGQGAAMLEAILQAGIALSPADTPKPLDLAEVQHSSGLKMPDAVVLACAKALGAKLATVDENLAKAAANLGVKLVFALKDK
ncbi:MAG: PIN domain-containing protein [Propionibacteriaceae bacterium]|jgi:predicted nucleic acid-binding protein|nr:PIN domain-containing protein [Propionibacteriaceae bacterium]